MSRSKAADVALALVNLGYACTVVPPSDGNVNSGWLVRVSSETGVAASTVATFATNQTVSAAVRYVEFA